MFTGYLLTEESRNRLKALYPPKYSDFVGEHVTEKFGVKKDAPAPAMPQTVRIVGYANDGDKVEGFLVEVNGTSERPSGGLYHLTWSLDRSKGAKPKDTNEVVLRAVFVKPFDLVVVPKNFHNR